MILFFIKKFLLIALFAFTALSSAHGASHAGEIPELRFVTGPVGGVWFNLGEELAEIWNASGIAKVKTGVGGGVSNILNIHSRRADIGFSVSSLFHAAEKAEGDFSGHSVQNVILIGNLYRQYTYFIMLKDFAEKYNISSIDDLIAKTPPMRFATLKPGTSSEFIVKALLKKGYNIDYKSEFKKWGGSIEYASYEGGADLLLNRHADCFAFSIGENSEFIKNLDSKINIIILSAGKAALDKLSGAYATDTAVINYKNYKINSVGDYTCLIARRDLSPEILSELSENVKNYKSQITQK